MVDEKLWRDLGRASSVLCLQSKYVREAPDADARLERMGWWAGAFAFAASESFAESQKESWTAGIEGAVGAAISDGEIPKTQSGELTIRERKKILNGASAFFFDDAARAAAIDGIVEVEMRAGQERLDPRGLGIWEARKWAAMWPELKSGGQGWREAAERLASRETSEEEKKFSRRALTAWSQAKAQAGGKGSAAKKLLDIEGALSWTGSGLDPSGAVFKRLGGSGLAACAAGAQGRGTPEWLEVESRVHGELVRLALALSQEASARSGAVGESLRTTMRVVASSWAGAALEAGARWEMAERARDRALWWSELVAESCPQERSSSAWRDDLELFSGVVDLFGDESGKAAARARLEALGAFSMREHRADERFAQMAAAVFARHALAANAGAMPDAGEDHSWREAATSVEQARARGVETAVEAASMVKTALEDLGSKMEFVEREGASGREWRKIYEMFGAKRSGLSEGLLPAVYSVAERLESLAVGFAPEERSKMECIAREMREGSSLMIARIESLEIDGALESAPARSRSARSL